MQRKTAIAILGAVLLFGSAVSSAAQVKRVQMILQMLMRVDYVAIIMP